MNEKAMGFPVALENLYWLISEQALSFFSTLSYLNYYYYNI